jgi:hypothetical protein
MTLIGGKRKVNKSLKAWVTFVKKVQKEEKLTYKDAIHRAKVRKDKGEKWMMGGSNPTSTMTESTSSTEMVIDEDPDSESLELVKKRKNDTDETMPIKQRIVTPGTTMEIVEEEIPLADTQVGEMMNTSTYGGKRRRTMRRRSSRRSRGKTARKRRARARGKSRGRY